MNIKNAVAVPDSQHNTGNVKYLLKIKDSTKVTVIREFDMFKNLENVEEITNLKDLLEKTGIKSKKNFFFLYFFYNLVQKKNNKKIIYLQKLKVT